MPKDPNTEAYDSQFFPDGDEMMQTILSRDPAFWDENATTHKEELIDPYMSRHLNTRVITGTSEPGATITVTDIDEITYVMPEDNSTTTPPPDGGEATDLFSYRKGISIAVTPPHDPGESPVIFDLYVPDDPTMHPDAQPPHGITLRGDRGRILKRGSAVGNDEYVFNQYIREIKRHLGDRVTWRGNREPTHETTKAELLNLIKDKVNGGTYIRKKHIPNDEGVVFQSFVSKTLWDRTLDEQTGNHQEYSVFYVFEEDRIPENGMTFVGGMSKITRHSADIEESVNYGLYTTPDGTLEIERHHNILDKNELMGHIAEGLAADASRDPERILKEEKAREARAEHERQSEQEELERGMRFVPQKETEALISELRNTYGSNPNAGYGWEK
jgi:hypothetical protein